MSGDSSIHKLSRDGRILFTRAYSNVARSNNIAKSPSIDEKIVEENINVPGEIKMDIGDSLNSIFNTEEKSSEEIEKEYKWRIKVKNAERLGICPEGLYPPPKPEYPYILNINNHEFPDNKTLEEFYLILLMTLVQNGVDFDPITESCKLRCLAYPCGERVDFNIAMYNQDKTNGRFLIEFHRYGGEGLLYYPLLNKIKVDLDLRFEGKPYKPLVMPDFNDDINTSHIPDNQEICNLIDMIDQTWPDICVRGLLLTETMLSMPGAVNLIMNAQIVHTITERAWTASKETEILRCSARVLRKIASSKKTALYLDDEAAAMLLCLIKLPTDVVDTLPYREVIYQSLLAVEEIISNSNHLIEKMKDIGLYRILINHFDNNCVRISNAAKRINNALKIKK